MNFQRLNHVSESWPSTIILWRLLNIMSAASAGQVLELRRHRQCCWPFADVLSRSLDTSNSGLVAAILKPRLPLIIGSLRISVFYFGDL